VPLKLKVALLNFCFEDYTVELANALHQLLNLTLIQPKNIRDYSQNGLDPDIKVCEFSKPRIRDLRNLHAMREMIRIIHKIQPNILHAQETNDPWYDFAIGSNRIPSLVTTIHDAIRHPGDRDSAPGSDYTRQISFHRSKQVIVHTEGAKQAVLSRFPRLRQRINVVPHGELGNLYQRRSKFTSVSREPYTLLFFGRLWPYKGLRYLLEAMPLITEQIPEVKLLIAGRGENIHEYFPEGYDTNRYHIFNHFVTPEVVVHLFQRSTVAVLPYIEASQSGVAAIAYGLGTPIIASNIGGLGDLIRHEEDGLLVPPRDVRALANAVIRLLRDRNLQIRIQASMLARCRRELNWSDIAEQTVEIYCKAT
jgi:glycosyltransferase involved in cell wall biosynthesis